MCVSVAGAKRSDIRKKNLIDTRFILIRMKVAISCRVRGDWFQVPCKDGELMSFHAASEPTLGRFHCHSGKHNIRWLGEEALRRYLKLRPPSFVPNREERVHDIRKTVGGAILDPEDAVGAVLDDNDFVSIGKSVFIIYFFYLNDEMFPYQCRNSVA